MVKLEEVISPGMVELALKGKNKMEVVEELINLLDKEHKLITKSDFMFKVLEREDTISTYCGYEVAIPHAISAAVKVPAVCFGRSEGFPWDKEDEWVRYVFLFAMPENDHHEEHIAIMSAIARCSLDPETREMWQKAKTSEQFLKSLRHSIQKG